VKPVVAVDRPNDLWTVDLKGWWFSGDRSRCEPLTVRDQLSRFVLCVQLLIGARCDAVRQIFEKLFEVFGLPRFILTDNGPPFVAPTSKVGLTVLSAWWLSLGIEHIRTRPGKPSDNGAHERMHADIAADVQAYAAFDRYSQQQACDRWRLEFNNERPHEALGMRVPAEVYTPSSTKWHGKPAAIEYPPNMHVRRVSNLGEIKYRDQRIRISKALRGNDVGLEAQPEGPHAVWFCHRRLGWLDLEHPEPKLEVEPPMQFYGPEGETLEEKTVV